MTRKNDATEEPTEMEAVVLGVLWQKGPCTAYAIRKEFMESISPRWSGSAGAIYPLLRRMEGLGLLRSSENNRGKRIQRDYMIEKKGLTVLRRWIGHVKPDSEIGLAHDPLRTKLFFIDALSKAQSEKLVRSALAELKKQLINTQRFAKESRMETNRASYFAARNLILVTQARIAWLDEILKSLK